MPACLCDYEYDGMRTRAQACVIVEGCMVAPKARIHVCASFIPKLFAHEDIVKHFTVMFR